MTERGHGITFLSLEKEKKKILSKIKQADDDSV